MSTRDICGVDFKQSATVDHLHLIGAFCNRNSDHTLDAVFALEYQPSPKDYSKTFTCIQKIPEDKNMFVRIEPSRCTLPVELEKDLSKTISPIFLPAIQNLGKGPQADNVFALRATDLQCVVNPSQKEYQSPTDSFHKYVMRDPQCWIDHNNTTTSTCPLGIYTNVKVDLLEDQGDAAPKIDGQSQWKTIGTYSLDHVCVPSENGKRAEYPLTSNSPQKMNIHIQKSNDTFTFGLSPA